MTSALAEACARAQTQLRIDRPARALYELQVIPTPDRRANLASLRLELDALWERIRDLEVTEGAEVATFRELVTAIPHAQGPQADRDAVTALCTNRLRYLAQNGDAGYDSIASFLATESGRRAEPSLRARLHLLAALCADRTLDPGRGRPHLDAAEELFRELKDPLGLADVKLMRGLNHMYGANWNLAAEELRSAATTYGASGAQVREYKSNHNLAVLYVWRGWFTKAEPLAVETVEKFASGALEEVSHKDVKVASAQANLGLLYLRTGRFDQADATLRSALDSVTPLSASNHSALRTAGLLHEYLGELGLNSGNFGMAKKHLKEAAAIADKLESGRMRFEVMRLQAALALVAGDVSEAKKLIDAALAHFGDHGLERTFCLRVRGHVRLLAGETDIGVADLMSALTFLDTMNEDFERHLVVYLLARRDAPPTMSELLSFSALRYLDETAAAELIMETAIDGPLRRIVGHLDTVERRSREREPEFEKLRRALRFRNVPSSTA